MIWHDAIYTLNAGSLEKKKKKITDILFFLNKIKIQAGTCITLQ